MVHQRSDGILGINALPGLVDEVSIRQPDATTLRIKLVNPHRNLLSYRQDFVGVADIVPADLADVDETIYAT